MLTKNEQTVLSSLMKKRPNNISQAVTSRLLRKHLCVTRHVCDNWREPFRSIQTLQSVLVYRASIFKD
jgi:hypothetical protein